MFLKLFMMLYLERVTHVNTLIIVYILFKVMVLAGKYITANMKEITNTIVRLNYHIKTTILEENMC